MKTSKIPKNEIDSLKELLLANNSDSNALGIVLAKQMGWEYCDIANFVIRSQPNIEYEFSFNFEEFRIELEEVVHCYGFRSSKLKCWLNKDMIDSVIHKYSLKPFHFDKACKILIKELGKRLEKKYKDV